jgi:hypothetical protein
MFVHQPDGYIRVGVYRGSLAEFLLLEPDYTLPEGCRGRVYIPGQQHSLFTATDQLGGPLPWPEGDAYLAKEAVYLAAQAEQRAAERAAWEMAEVSRPNPDGFLRHLPTIFGADLAGLMTLSREYPAFPDFVRYLNGPAIQWCILDAQSRELLTPAQYDACKAAVRTYHLPDITLP